MSEVPLYLEVVTVFNVPAADRIIRKNNKRCLEASAPDVGDEIRHMQASHV